MNRFIPALLLFLMLPIAHAAGALGSQSWLSCSSLFANSVNGKPLVSPAIAAYSTYSGLMATALLVVLMMFVVMGVVYGLGIALRYDKLKNFVKTEYLEGFVSIIMIIFIMGGLAAFSGAESFIANLFGLFAGTAPISSTVSLYSSLCTNVFSNMIVPGALNYLGVLANEFMTSLISGFTIELQPGGFGVAFSPFSGFALLNQLFWIEKAGALFMIASGGMLIVLLFVIYYLFPLFLFVGVALRTFPWTRAAGGAFIALFIAFYIFFPVIMYPFTVTYSSSSPVYSAQASGICGSGGNACGSGGSLGFLGSFKAYLGVLDLDIGYSAYTNLLVFSQIFAYFGIELFGLLISLLISYELIEVFGRLLGATNISGRSLLAKIFTSKH